MPTDEQDFVAQIWKPPSPAKPESPAPRRSGLWIAFVVTASLFLPGSGQLLNRTWLRATVILTIWFLAWLTHLTPVWTLICIYAAIEAGITAARPRKPTPSRNP